ncbi:MAG: hypothetical protein LBG91_03565 [Treponema sp.]|nr:hypothetical protein [Treponema sp.]
MSKKGIAVIFIFLLFMAGIIALTQEADDHDLGMSDEPQEYGEDISAGYPLAKEFPEWVKPARWFRSNKGGMAIEEIPSRLAALRNEYALVIDFVYPEEMPEYLSQYYKDEYYVEKRTFYKNGEEFRMQWIFRDENGTTRLLAVFTENAESINSEENNDDSIAVNSVVTDDVATDGIEGDSVITVVTDGVEDDGAEIVVTDGVEANDVEGNGEKNNIAANKTRSGFIEIYDETASLTSEFRFSDDGGKDKTDYYYKNGVIIYAETLTWEKAPQIDIPQDDVDVLIGSLQNIPLPVSGGEGEFKKIHTDYYRYNRSSFLRAVERVFHREVQINTFGDSVTAAFPNRIMDAAQNDSFINEKLNPYPEFFGDISVNENSSIVFTTDERGRILTQTLRDEEDNIIWVIRNTWLKDRIVFMTKTEGDTELVTEYEYDPEGKQILEKNTRNGVLERLVRMDGKTETEELYLNGVAILLAVWEDGRKISESRIKNN